MPPHYLDWDNQPIPFKIYKTLDPINIPKDLPFSNTPTLEALISSPDQTDVEIISNLPTLGRLLFLSAGITKKRRCPGGEIFFRAAACTGALYHIELYVVTKNIDGLDAGVYHFGPHDFSLRKLRGEDLRGVVVDATSEEPSISKAPTIVICTSTFWRNSWKYQSRAYRHTFWDTGTVLANLIAAANAYKIPTRIVSGFVDDTINKLIDLDTNREVAVSLVPIGRTNTETQARKVELDKLSYETMTLSRKEIDYQSIRRMHEASSLFSKEEVNDWRDNTIESETIDSNGGVFPLDGDDYFQDAKKSRTIEQTILKRGSTRQFSREPITFKQLSYMLFSATRGIPADFLNPFGTTLNDIYVIVNDVDHIPKGSYFYDQKNQKLELLKEGDFRREAGHLGLGQDIPADASADVFFLADLEHILGIYGNRGYRVAELEAGILGGRLYLSAYSLGLGASGLTFFDDEVTEFFSPHAKGKSVMFLIALGKSVRSR
ncbi:MAG: SagB/ThcOx family dehydrogenase [Deltaproteobacteria bacterium]|nr:SagB/ThcOx family dehydrogenase [Deltaproteobacteria bacterium]